MNLSNIFFSRRILSPKRKIFCFLLLFLPLILHSSILQPYENAETFSNSPLSLDSLIKSAKELFHNGDYEKSAAIYSDCVALAKKAGLKEEELICLKSLGLSYWNLGKIQESHECYSLAHSISKSILNTNDTEECARILQLFKFYQEGKEFRSAGKLDNSISSFTQAINLSRTIKSLDHELKCLRQLGTIYWQQEDFKNFFPTINNALQIAIKTANKREESMCLNNLGLYYWRIDSYSAALSSYEKAYELSKQMASIDQSVLPHNIGMIWAQLGNYDKALEYLKNALDIDEKVGSNTELDLDLNTIGATLIKKGISSESAKDFEQAIIFFIRSLEFSKNNNNKENQMLALNNIGSAKSHLKLYSEALDYFSRALNEAIIINNQNALGTLYNNIGIVHANLGNYIESTKYYQKAIDVALGIKGGNILWEAYFENANVLKKQDKFEEAKASYLNSIRIIEEIRSSLIQEELKASYLGTGKRIDVYENLIDLLVTHYLDNHDRDSGIEAFHVLEKAKARAFLDSLEVSEVSVSQGVDIVLANQEKEIMREISLLYTKLLMPNMSPEEKAEINNQLKGFDDKLESLKREIRTTSPAYANLKYPEVITYSDAIKLIARPDKAYYAFSVGKEHTYVFVLSGKNLKIFRAPSRETIRQQVAEYRKRISDKDNKDFQLGNELFKELILPGLSVGLKTIVFIPDDILNLLPFEALVTEKDRRWLIQDFAVSYAPSLSSLRELSRRSKGRRSAPHKDLLAFGDPYYGKNEESRQKDESNLFQDFYSNPSLDFYRLNYSGLEVQRIGSLFAPSRIKTYLRKEASEDHLKTEPLAEYKIIHFATHGLIDDKKPARSSIILSLDQDPAEDGFLQMREVFNLKMNSDLVVLSACQTGLGPFIRGEGIEGLSRAFFYAGASSVLMSLWAVNDEATYQLMERFYFHLRHSIDSIHALRKAKLELIDSKLLSHPYYWAGFTLSGKTDAAIFSAPPLKRILFISSLIIGAMFFILAAIRIRRKR